MSEAALKSILALFSSASPSHPTTLQAEKRSGGEDFLKLDNDVSISTKKIIIGTVLYDRSSSPTRAGSWATRLFSFIKEWRAARWVATFVSTHLKDTRGSTEFVKNIREHGGVRRNEFIDFLITQRLDGKSTEVLEGRKGSRSPGYQIGNVDQVIKTRLLSAFGTHVSDQQIAAFLAFIDSSGSQIDKALRADASGFVVGFKQFCSENPSHSLVMIMQGKVDLLAQALGVDQARRSVRNADESMSRESSVGESPDPQVLSTPHTPRSESGPDGVAFGRMSSSHSATQMDWTAFGRKGHLELSDMQLINGWLTGLDPKLADQETKESIDYLLSLRNRDYERARTLLTNQEDLADYRKSLDSLVGFPAILFLAKVAGRAQSGVTSPGDSSPPVAVADGTTSAMQRWLSEPEPDSDSDTDSDSDSEEDDRTNG